MAKKQSSGKFLKKNVQKRLATTQPAPKKKAKAGSASTPAIVFTLLVFIIPPIKKRRNKFLRASKTILLFSRPDYPDMLHTIVLSAYGRNMTGHISSQVHDFVMNPGPSAQELHLFGSHDTKPGVRGLYRR